MLGKDLAAMRLIATRGTQRAVAPHAEQGRFNLLCAGAFHDTRSSDGVRGACDASPIAHRLPQFAHCEGPDPAPSELADWLGEGSLLSIMSRS